MNLTPILAKAVIHPLSEAEAREAALGLMSGEVSPAQVGGFLGVLRARGEAAAEILGFARALRERATVFPSDPHGLVDTCGTGGDGTGTFNVSTLAGLVAAAAGARVAKHGNRAVSSRCGSADVLEMLGVRIDGSPSFTARCLDSTGFGFLFAPHYHPTLKHLGPIRRELGFRSIFNLVGPLANPARVTRQVVGVPAASYLEPVAHALQALGAAHAFVVHGDDGSDEISLVGPTSVIEVRPFGLSRFSIRPEDVGLSSCRPVEIAGGEANTNAAIARAVLDGEGGPARDFVVLNAAAALVVSGIATSMREGVERARDAVLSFRARAVTEQLQRLSQEAA